MRRALCLAACAAAALSPLSAAPLDGAWEKAEQFRFNEACDDFRAARGKPGVDERERAFGEALALLNRQPRGQDNIVASQKLFADLAASGGTMALPAAFFLARIDEFYTDPPRPGRAGEEYRRLLALRSGNPLVESAAAELVLMEGYGRDDAAAAHRLDALEPLGPFLLSSSGRREFHYALGSRCVELGEWERGLSHLLAADREGFPRWQTEADAWLAIADTAGRLKNDALARAYYAKYLAKYPRDRRHFTIEKRLRSLDERGAGASS